MTGESSRITDLSQLPLVLTIDEIAMLYRRAKSTIRRNIQLHRFTPVPFDGPPYRWLRAHVERDLQRRVPPARSSAPRRRRTRALSPR
jgi:hypothetical protein